MRASELREKTEEELREELESLFKLLLSLNMKKALGYSGSLDVRTVRCDIARVKLVLSERGISV
ncbi:MULTISPECIES: 50S ribosomal protein L29 [Candidatus Ichthyocystis]|uniref:Large ribosomal subunit protein uL29 n=1 Tax=Candidatus Ichthyocystis hellenicum TaxID=1561003 RepID=A0A0S4M0U8_9BURK|nr:MULTISPECIES: 50S ribosomal protein L29 [Ichthyocystis]CUT17358.1 50S ribosomal protein L29 [Candidatus Ichthyocystis hellenicum]